MRVEEMNMDSYPIKASRSPSGDTYDKPRPATHIWKVNYLTSLGEIRHEFYKAEISSPVAEIPAEELRILEKRMTKPGPEGKLSTPEKIVSVSFGLLYEQKEPGGPWERPNPNDKDPRAEKFFTGNYTELYLNDWRKKAYESEYDTLKLTRSYSKEDALRVELEKVKREAEEAQRKLEIEKQNTLMLKGELAKKGK